MLKFVVTGLPRSGTKYMSEVIKTLGIPCGHEEVFTPAGREDDDSLVADVSWMAVPFLKELKEEGVKIIVLRRDINDVIRSLQDLRFFDLDYNPSYRKAYRDFAIANTTIFPISYTNWTVDWFNRAFEYADVVIDLESISNNFGIPKDINNRDDEKTAIRNSSLQ